jgi:hypothetical protein
VNFVVLVLEKLLETTNSFSLPTQELPVNDRTDVRKCGIFKFLVKAFSFLFSELEQGLEPRVLRQMG